MEKPNEALAKAQPSIEDLIDSPAFASSHSMRSESELKRTPLQPRCGQAAHILAKFGGAPRLAAILTVLGKPRHRISIYKWTYPRDHGGTDGLIPTSAWPDVLKAARYAGVLLEPADYDLRINGRAPK